MSDFLSNLIARTLKPDAVIQARWPSLFEPSPVGGLSTPPDQAPDGMEAPDAERGAPAPDATPAPPAQAARRPGAVEARRSQAAPEGVPSDEGDRRQETSLAQRAPLHVADHQLEAPSQRWRSSVSLDVRHPSATTDLRSAPIKARATEEEGPRRSGGEQPSLWTGEASQERSASVEAREALRPAPEPIIREIVVERSVERVAPPASRESGGPMVSVPSPEPELEGAPRRPATRLPPEPRPGLEPPTVVVRPQVSALGLDQFATPAADEPPSPAPTVQVTIGRVEVRAVPPPEKPAEKRSQPAVMTLDEYLRLRTDGGSR